MNEVLASTILRAASFMDEHTLSAGLRAALGGRSVALCFHRVASERRAGELRPKLTMAPAEIDALLTAVTRATAGRVTASFDDGYLDSAEYILSRAARFPQVEWIFFVCPAKSEARVGFRWDLAETRRRMFPGLDAEALLDEPLHPALENARPELRALAAQPAFALADLETLRRVQRLPNGALGNHSNAHGRLAALPLAEAQAELAQSTRDFERLFGPQRHFAFPFGVPSVDFSPAHVEALRALSPALLWTTEPRPFAEAERHDGAVLPRFAVDGTRSWKQTAAQIALHALRTRAFSAPSSHGSLEGSAS